MITQSLNIVSSRKYDKTKTNNPKNILLINPPSGFLLDDKVFLPTGLALLAGANRERGHDIKLMDLASRGDYVEAVVKEVLEKRYDAVGITATSPQFYYAYKILQGLKQNLQTPPVIIGGSHASMFSSLRKNLASKFMLKGFRNSDLENRIHEEDINFEKLERFDIIADGEENSLQLALDSLGKGQKWIDGGVTLNLDDLPLPARDLFDFKSYLVDPAGTPKFRINEKPSGSLISQRGCPYQCEFCCGRDSVMYHRVKLPGGILRTRSPEKILEELDSMHTQFGLESFMFYDDEFNLHPERTTELCNALKSRNYNFRGFVKGDLLVNHPEVAIVMKKAGFAEVLSGIESGSDRILGRHLHKRTSPELNYKAAMICLDNQIGFKALTMIGHTSETEEDVLKTRDWLLNVGRKFNEKLGSGHFTFDLTVFQPYAGCPIWDKSERNIDGEFADQYAWAYYTRDKSGNIIDNNTGGIYFNKVDFSTEHGFYKGVPGQYRAFIRTKGLSAERLVYLRDSIYAEIRDKLKMPTIISPTPANQYEHSMGQTGSIKS